MSTSTNFLAVDLGASSGRVMLGRWNGQVFGLEELHRFPNNPLRNGGKLLWNVEELWAEIKRGLQLYATKINEPLKSIAVDSWAIDYGLLDQAGQLSGLPFHYRDHRTDGIMEEVLAKVGKSRIYSETGLQFLPFNTLYQLYSQAKTGRTALIEAVSFLMIPDLFHYRLSGKKVAEYTNATTTQFFSATKKDWATGLLDELDIPRQFLPEIVPPGTILGELLPELANEVGLRQPEPVLVVAPGTHDTASAVAAIPYLDEKSAYISSGTWSLVGVEAGEPVLSSQALKLNFTNEGGVANTIRLLKNVMGLWLVQECQRHFREAGQNYSWAELIRLSTETEPFTSLIDPDAPDFLNPASMPEAIQAYCRRTGQPVPNSPGALIRCCLESLALKYRVVINQLESLLGYGIETIRVVGGGSQNEALCQYTADACQREVVAGPVEATALGNIMLQAIATGQLQDVAAGRKALQSSVTLKSYVPAANVEWPKALERFERLLALA
ncbi:MAG TPA: rhamnulokinase family protein [Chloroflexia bacterium]|nr:rhamnulokinase family protein [Chloroflexia bacterium]